MKKILIISSILVVLLAAGAIYYFKWRHNFIRNKVPELVYLKSDSVYNITYGDVYIDEINGEVIINNLVLWPDTTRKKDPDYKVPNVMLAVSIPQLHLTGLHTDEAMLNEQVIARRLTLSRPVVTLFTNNRDKKAKHREEEEEFETHDLYKVILRNLTKIQVDTIMIDTAEYHMVRWGTSDTTISGSPVNVALYDLNISDSASTDTSRVLFAKKALVTIDSLRINNESDVYNYNMSAIQLNSIDNTLTIKRISIDPRLGEDAFARAAGKQTDRFDVRFSGATLNRIDVDEVLDGNIVAENMVIREGIIKIYRDKSYPRNNVNKVGRYPHQLLMNMPVAVAIGRLDINSGYIEYKEKSDLTGNSGRIRFTDIKLSIANLNNRRRDLKNNAACIVSLRARFLDVAPLSVTMKLYPASDNGKFSVDGTLGGADATAFNQLAQPLGMASIESGMLNSCSFHFNGNDYQNVGTVKVLYKDLKVQLLQKDGADGQYKPKKFASFLANAALKDDNPRRNKPPRIAHVNYKRDVYKSFFNLVWKSIFTGIGETVGIDAKNAKTDSR